MILVDTNVLLDLVGDDTRWAAWSMENLQAAALEGPLLINPIIYAEVSVRYQTVEALDSFVEGVGLQMSEIPKSALFLAAKAYSAYRSAGGMRTGVLSDFFIGAHASVMHLPILTRDVKKYGTYFPDVNLSAPSRS